MTPKDIRLANPILGGLMLAAAATQNTGMAAQALFPRLPTSLRGFQLAQMGDEATRKYNTRRAPGAATKQVKIGWEGKTYTVAQHAIDVPIPRELIQEQDEARRLNVGANIDVSQIAVNTALQILNLSYELEAAAIATDPGAYGANTRKLTNATNLKHWNDKDGKPVTDVRGAIETVRGSSGRRPNTLVIGATVLPALAVNAEVKGYLPSTNLGPATLDQLKSILGVPNIVVADAIVTDEDGTVSDVWADDAILAYVPNIGANGAGLSLGEPAFGFTSWMEGHPFIETPYYDRATKSWIYGATFERSPTLVRASAGYLFEAVLTGS